MNSEEALLHVSIDTRVDLKSLLDLCNQEDFFCWIMPCWKRNFKRMKFTIKKYKVSVENF